MAWQKGQDHDGLLEESTVKPPLFTREDLKLLERCEASVGWKYEEEVRDLAKRIEALLPPE